jgi:hypothetical protein
MVSVFIPSLKRVLSSEGMIATYKADSIEKRKRLEEHNELKTMD